MKTIVIFFSLFVLALGISYTAKMNRVLNLRMKGPSLEKRVQEEEAKKAKYELEWLIYTNPERLLQLKDKPQFGHLVFPTHEQTVVLDEGVPHAP